MRPIELILILTLAAAILRRTLLADWAWPSWSPALLVGIATLLVLHLALEGWRPQMLPAYIVAVAWLMLLIVPMLPGMPDMLPRGTALRLVAAGVAGATLLATVGLCVARPVIQAPAPNGSFAVGTTTVPLFVGASEPVFQIWYPSRAGTGAGLSPLVSEPRVATRRGWLSRGAAVRDAALIANPARLPVLLFFPGWGGVPSNDTVLLQDLASHGYIVCAADAWDPAAYPGDAAAAADLMAPLVFDSNAATTASMAVGARNAPRQARLARHVLDRLAMLDRNDPAGRFTARLDLDHVGMLGFSFGGSVAVETSVDDRRVRAVANLDGGVFTDAYLRGFAQPYLLLSEPPMTEADLHSPDPAIRYAAVPTLEDEARIASFMERWGGMRVIIAGMEHVNFQDAPLLNDWRRVGGVIDPQRARRILDAFLLAFFDHHLRGAPAPVPLDVALAYPEVTLRRWHAGPIAAAALDSKAPAAELVPATR